MRYALKKYSAMIYFCLDVPLNAVNYLFIVILSSYLTQIDYGRANAYMALWAILVTPGIALQSAVAQHVAPYQRTTTTLDKASRYGVKVWIIFLFVAIPFFRVILDSSIMAMIVLVVAVIVHLYLSWWRGTLQGNQSFLRLSSSMYSDIPFRFGTALLLFPLVALPEIAVVCTLIASTISLVWTFYQAPHKHYVQHPHLSLANNVVPFIFQLGFMQICMNLDLLVVNHLNPAESGFYAATIRYGQLIAYLMLSLQTVLIPILAHKQLQIRLKYLITPYLVLGFIVVLLYRFVVPLTIPYLFGKEYTVISDELPWVAMSYLSYALLNVFILIFIIQRIKFYTVIMGCVLLGLILLYPLMAGSIRTILYTQLLVYTTACGVFAVYFTHKRNVHDNFFS